MVQLYQGKIPHHSGNAGGGANKQRHGYHITPQQNGQITVVNLTGNLNITGNPADSNIVAPVNWAQLLSTLSVSAVPPQQPAADDGTDTSNAQMTGEPDEDDEAVDIDDGDGESKKSDSTTSGAEQPQHSQTQAQRAKKLTPKDITDEVFTSSVSIIDDSKEDENAKKKKKAEEDLPTTPSSPSSSADLNGIINLDLTNPSNGNLHHHHHPMEVSRNGKMKENEENDDDIKSKDSAANTTTSQNAGTLSGGARVNDHMQSTPEFVLDANANTEEENVNNEADETTEEGLSNIVSVLAASASTEQQEGTVPPSYFVLPSNLNLNVNGNGNPHSNNNGSPPQFQPQYFVIPPQAAANNNNHSQQHKPLSDSNHNAHEEDTKTAKNDSVSPPPPHAASNNQVAKGVYQQPQIESILHPTSVNPSNKPASNTSPPPLFPIPLSFLQSQQAHAGPFLVHPQFAAGYPVPQFLVPAPTAQQQQTQPAQHQPQPQHQPPPQAQPQRAQLQTVQSVQTTPNLSLNSRVIAQKNQDLSNQEEVFTPPEKNNSDRFRRPEHDSKKKANTNRPTHSQPHNRRAQQPAQHFFYNNNGNNNNNNDAPNPPHPDSPAYRPRTNASSHQYRSPFGSNNKRSFNNSKWFITSILST